MRRLRNESGQMTIEFVVAFPVLLAIALIAVNVTLFLSDCSGFDRAFREEVCSLAPSPAYGEDQSDIAGKVEKSLSEAFDQDYLDVEVTASGGAGGLVTYEGTLTFSPTLFGEGRLTGAFGVSFPRIEHEQRIVIDAYKPGVLL